jgi:hypothetical protein
LWRDLDALTANPVTMNTKITMITKKNPLVIVFIVAIVFFVKRTNVLT